MSNTVPDKRCLGCDYNLRGLSVNRCPECGRWFDPNDAMTYLAKLKSGRRYVVFALVGLVMMVAPLIDCELRDRELIEYRGVLGLTLQVILMPSMPASLVVECLVLSAALNELRRPRDARLNPRCWRAAFLISLMTLISFAALQALTWLT